VRVLILIHIYPPEHAPAGINAAELAQELTDAGHEVTVLTGFPSHPAGPLFDGWKAKFYTKERTDGGFTVVRCIHSFAKRFRLLPKLWYYGTFALGSFVVGLHQESFDVMIMQSTPLFGNFTGVLLAKLRRAKVFYWIQDVHPESAINAGLIKEGLATAMMKKLDTWVCRRSDVVGTLTDDMRQLLLDRGLSEEHVVLQRHWLDESRIYPMSRMNGWRHRFDIPPEKFVVLHAGTIGYISGAAVIIEAARLLRNRDDLLFLFVGDGPLKSDLEKMSADYGLSNVKFLPFQPEEDVNEMQATGDVGLVTLKPRSGASSIPSKMHGYTAAGRPVIAGVDAESATSRLISEGDFGWVPPPSDAGALAEAISAAASDPALCQQKGARARVFFEREFGRKAVTRKFRVRLEAMASRGWRRS